MKDILESFRENINALKKSRKELESMIQPIVSDMKGGRLFSVPNITAFGEALDRYAKEFDDCDRQARSLCDNSGLPREIKGLDALMSKAEKNIGDKIMEERARQFLLLETNDAGLISELSTEQEKLRKLFANSKKQSAGNDCLKPYADFVMCMAQEDPVQRLQNLTSLTERFSKILVAKAFLENVVVLPDKNASKPETDNNPTGTEALVEQEPQGECVSPDSTDVNLENELSQFAQALIKNHALITDKEQLAEETHVEGGSASKKDFSTKRVKQRLAHGLPHFILMGMKLHGIMSTLMMQKNLPAGITEQYLQNGLQNLVDRGFLQRIICDEMVFYEPTNACKTLFKTEKFEELFGPISLYIKQTPFQPEALLARLGWIKMAERLNVRDGMLMWRPLLFTTEGFVGTFRIGSASEQRPVVHTLFFGIYCVNAVDSDGLYHCIEKLLNEADGKIEYAIFSGFDLLRASGAYLTLNEVFGDYLPDENDVFCYALNEDKFYRHISKEEVTGDMILDHVSPFGIDNDASTEEIESRPTVSTPENVNENMLTGSEDGLESAPDRKLESTVEQFSVKDVRQAKINEDREGLRTALDETSSKSKNDVEGQDALPAANIPPKHKAAITVNEETVKAVSAPSSTEVEGILDAGTPSETVDAGTSPSVDTRQENDFLEQDLVGDDLSDEILQKLFAEDTLHEEQALTDIYDMLARGRHYCAMACFDLLANTKPEYQKDAADLAYALDEPSRHLQYAADSIYGLVEESNTFKDMLLVSAALRTFFYNHVEYESGMQRLYDTIRPSFMDVNPLSEFAFQIMRFKASYHKGVDCYAAYRQQHRIELEKELTQVRHEARNLYKAWIETRQTHGFRRLIEAEKIVFSANSEMGQCLEAAMEDNREYLDIIRSYLKETLIKDKCPIDEVNLDRDKIDAVIQDAWMRAINALTYARQSSDLMGSMYRRFYKAIEKVGAVLCRWVSKATELGARDGGEAQREYQKMVPDLKKKLASATSEIEQRRSETDDIAAKAGMSVLLFTLDELSQRIEGQYNALAHKYFYLDFLRGSDILLTEEFVPWLGSPQISGILFSSIKEHSMKKLLPSFEERIDAIFTGGEDDYGSARLIWQYLMEADERDILAEKGYDLEANRQSAQNSAQNLLRSFIEGVELAQSYGQLDSVAEHGENKKETLLRLMQDWYRYAVATGNYGAFSKKKVYFEQRIKKDAEIRGEQLLKELAEHEKNILPSQDADRMKKRCEKVKNMIQLQNYTVAEDWMARLASEDEESEHAFEGNVYLNEFLDRYDDLYRRVSNSAETMQEIAPRIIQRAAHNKKQRAGNQLIDNWPNFRTRGGVTRLQHLLNLFQFRVSKPLTKLDWPASRFDLYQAEVDRARNGRRENYAHPIAVFGSLAEETGFRVACLYGRYDANELLERFREIGNAKHTLVLLDYALTLPERRALARKIKEAMLGKVFAVIDRVVLMYIIDNYSETQAGRMLMSIIMPFASYQPYIWESSNVMPPEMFIGRKDELAQIESPTGVNIVYGGRQLGKSALLKKARQDIDRNENNDRAILIDIKGKDYRATALKISQVLQDEEFFRPEEAVETDQWEVLSRAIKKRMQEEGSQKIPYFLLMLDEADAFIESCKDVNFAPFDELKDIQGIGNDRFKFVIAGLRNIVRFDRDRALGGNSVLTHLKKMTVMPFKLTEAKELIKIPLQYLGLVFPEVGDTLIPLILASTNYFPGLIQLYCAKLIEAMMKKDYAGYNQIDSPIYEVKETHIKKVLADQAFRDEIKEKFEITLRLDEDNYYYLIALLIAYLYYEQSNYGGYNVKEILDVSREYGLRKISELDEARISALLEELVELNVLRRTPRGGYLFNRQSFFQIMGDRESIEKEILKYMEDV